MKKQRMIPDEAFLRTVKHVDPNGRINIGRKFAFQSFSLVTLSDGRILLAPIEFVEKHRMQAWRNAVRNGEPARPPDPLYHIPNEL